MTYAAKILADSIDNREQARLTTMEATFPRFILAEFNTHRVFSRNSASSRAIPVEKRIAQVRENPFVPEAFTKNQKGMQADVTLADAQQSTAEMIWRKAAESACVEAEALAALGVHKQHANRLIEPFCWHTVVVTSTEWKNFFRLRTDKAAQPEMQIIAKLMREAYEASEPRVLHPGDWHLPYVDVAIESPLVYSLPGVPLTATAIDPSLPDDEVRKIVERAFLPYIAASVVRCAAVSYERQHAERPLEELLARHDNLAASGHWSPFEHQAKVADRSRGELPRPGNFRPPWTQYRKMFDGESVWEGGGA